MGQQYTLVGQSTSIGTAARDIMEIVPATNRPIKLYSFRLGQITKAQDANDSLVRFQWVRGFTTAGSGGTTGIVPGLVGSPSNGAAAGAVGAAWNTTKATGGTGKVLWEDVFDIRAGMPWVPLPEERLECSAAQNRIVLTFPDTLPFVMSFSVTVSFEEIG